MDSITKAIFHDIISSFRGKIEQTGTSESYVLQPLYATVKRELLSFLDNYSIETFAKEVLEEDGNHIVEEMLDN